MKAATVDVQLVCFFWRLPTRCPAHSAQHPRRVRSDTSHPRCLDASFRFRIKTILQRDLTSLRHGLHNNGIWSHLKQVPTWILPSSHTWLLQTATVLQLIYVAFFGLWTDVMNPTVLLLVFQLLVFISRLWTRPNWLSHAVQFSATFQNIAVNIFTACGPPLKVLIHPEQWDVFWRPCPILAEGPAEQASR